MPPPATNYAARCWSKRMRKEAMNGIYALAKRDPRVVFIGSDLGAGTLDEMRREMPGRWFMEGVSEQAIIGMAAGLAMDGFIPYINTIATFLTRRCLEQVAIDLCLHKLQVRLIASGGGAVYAPLGPTHMALDDIALLRPLPNMTIVAPADAPEMTRAMEGTLDVPGPVYIRIAKGNEPVITRVDHGFTVGKAIALRAGRDVLFVSTGAMSARALRAAESLAGEGVDAGILHMHTIKPLDDEALARGAASARLVVTLEEHTRIGGLGSAVLESLSDADISVPALRLALPDRFSRDYGSQEHVLAVAGLDDLGITASVRTRLERLAVLK
jgi:transketolase